MNRSASRAASSSSRFPWNRAGLLAASLVAALTLSLSGAGARAFAAEAPADVLAGKGLVKVGNAYLLQAEIDLVEAHKSVRAAKTKLDADARQRQQLEANINRAKAAAANWDYEKKQLVERGQNERVDARRQQIIAAIRDLDARMEQAAAFRAEQERALRALGESAKGDYIARVVEAADLAEKASEGYKALAADPAVRGAIDALNAAGRGPKVTLGPQSNFATIVAYVRNARSQINSTVVPIRTEGRTPQVEVTLNGKLTRTFTLDSGAASVVLPADLAEEIGLNPTDKDPTIRAHLADGRVVEAKAMVLKSVKVGPFTVVDVDCTVMPKHLVAVTPLLGGSWLNNFIYKVDPEAGELHLAMLAGAGSKVKVGEIPPSARRDPPVVPSTPKATDAGTGAGTGTGTGGTTTTPRPTTPDVRPGGGGGDVTAPPTRPDPGLTPDPVTTPATPRRDPFVSTPEQTKKVLSYLESEYKRKLESPDWRQRALAVISLARLPHPEVTEKLMQLVDQDKHDVVRLIAWQAVLSRAASLKPQEHAKWVASTLTLAEKGAFRGSLRPVMLDVLATAPPNARSKKVFLNLVAATNGWETADVPTLRALGRTLAAWHSGSVARDLVNAMSDQNAAYRIEYILQLAGVKVTSAADRMPPGIWNPQGTDRVHVSSETLWQMVQKDMADYLRQNARDWADSTKVQGEPWKNLGYAYVPPPVSVEELESNQALWKADLELGRANLKAFEVAFVVDATGSMGEVHAWLSRDVLKFMAALGTASLEPRIGVTFYRDRGEGFVTKHTPLTHRGEELVNAVKSVGAVGGGDVAEAVLAGLTEAINSNRWDARQQGGKAVVLIGDAPPHANEAQQCVELARQAAEKGFRVYAAKVTTSHGANDLAVFDEIARAGNGQAVAIVFGQLGRVRFVDPKHKEIPLLTIPRPEAQLTIAPGPVGDQAAEVILQQIISDAINPQYRDRLAPLSRTLLAYCEQPSPPEKRLPFPANTPPAREGKFDPQGR